MHALLDCRIAMPAKSRCSIYSNQCLLSSQPVNTCTVETHTLPGFVARRAMSTATLVQCIGCFQRRREPLRFDVNTTLTAVTCVRAMGSMFAQASLKYTNTTMRHRNQDTMRHRNQVSCAFQHTESRPGLSRLRRELRWQAFSSQRG